MACSRVVAAADDDRIVRGKRLAAGTDNMKASATMTDRRTRSRSRRRTRGLVVVVEGRRAIYPPLSVLAPGSIDRSMLLLLLLLLAWIRGVASPRLALGSMPVWCGFRGGTGVSPEANCVD